MKKKRVVSGPTKQDILAQLSNTDSVLVSDKHRHYFLRASETLQ